MSFITKRGPLGFITRGKIRDPFGLILKDKGPPPLEALPPTPTRDSPEVLEAARRQAEADRLRKGRRSTILTSRRGVEDKLGTVNRPEASTLLGE